VEMTGGENDPNENQWLGMVAGFLRGVEKVSTVLEALLLPALFRVILALIFALFLVSDVFDAGAYLP
jgi:hypothetical protein